MLLHLGERLTDKGTTSPERALILWTAMYRMNIKTTLYTKKWKFTSHLIEFLTPATGPV